MVARAMNGRCEPDKDTGARARLQAAGLDLYASKGFDETTVAQIARTVRLTERTFFRHFADKREVVFSGQARSRSSSPVPFEMLRSTIEAITTGPSFLDRDHREFSRRRRAVIATHAELQERELLKMASLTAAIAAAMRDRGVDGPSASLLAEHGVAAFRLAFDQWIEVEEDRSLVEMERGLFRDFRATITASPED